MSIQNSDEQDKRVQDYYESLSLSPEKMEHFKQIAADANAPVARRTKLGVMVESLKAQLSSPVIRAVAAVVAVLVVSTWMYSSGTDTESTERTLREVAMNHSTRLEPEYKGDSLAELDSSMQQLPFALALPKDIKKKYALVGSRDCSLGGILAAHIKFQDRDSGKPVSLFVAHNASELKKVNAQQSTVEGVDVEFWREGGLFYALAHRS